MYATMIWTLLYSIQTYLAYRANAKLEDLKVLMCSPDLFDNVKIGHGQLRLIINHILFTIYGSCSHIGQVTLNNLMNTPSNSPVISEKPMFR